MGSRRKAREFALQMLYQYDIAANPMEKIVENFDDLQKSPMNKRFVLVACCCQRVFALHRQVPKRCAMRTRC